jgi:hypothetical protein
MVLIMGTNLAPYLLAERTTGQSVENAFYISDNLGPINFLSNDSLHAIEGFVEQALVGLYLWGHSAVYVFLFLSGSAVGRFFRYSGSTQEFLFWRYLNIYIPSVLVLIALYIFWLSCGGRGGQQYLLQILLGATAFGSGQVSTPSWFLSVLYVSYLVAPVFQKILQCTPTSVRKAILIILFPITFQEVWFDQDLANYAYPIGLVSFFLLGQIAGQSDLKPKKFREIQNRLNSFWPLFIVISILIVNQLSYRDFASRNFLRIILSLSLILIYKSVNDFNKDFRCRLKIQTAIDFISRGGMIVFLTHYPIFMSVYHTDIFLRTNQILFFCCFAASIYFFSAVFQKIIVTRVQSLLR